MISSVGTPSDRSDWYICSLLSNGTLKSLSPARKRVGVVMRSACRNGNETRV